MRSFALTTFAAAALALAASTARADVVMLDSFTFGPATSLSVGSPNYTGVAGQFSGLRNGNAFETFCVDLLQVFHFGQTYTNYSLVDGAIGFGSKSSMLDHAMSYFMSTGYPSNAATSATAQAVIWEVLYESSSKYGFSTGSFKATSPSGVTQAELNAFDWAALNNSPITHHVDRLFSPTAQDFLVVSRASVPDVNRVPEPSSITLVAAALLGCVAISRRRKTRN